MTGRIVVAEIVLCVLFTAIAVYAQSGRALAFDLSVHRVVRGAGNPVLIAAMHAGPLLGSLTVILSPLAALRLVALRRRAAAAVLLASVVGMGVTNLLLKGAFHRLRPGQAGTPSTFSGYLFPSTHTVLTIVTYGLLAYIVGQGLDGRCRATLYIITAALVGFVSISLVYLDTHYCTDVVAGLLIGGAWLIASLVLLRRVELSIAACGRPHRAAAPRGGRTAMETSAHGRG